MTSRIAASAAAVFLAATAPVEAQTEAQAEAQAEAGRGVPTSAAAPAASRPTPVCTDRPTNANVVCTVPAGAFQVEADLVNWTRTSAPGARADAVLYTNPTVKYGLGATTDVEVSIAPYETVRTRAGVVVTLGSVGDLYVRVKQRLVGAQLYLGIAKRF